MSGFMKASLPSRIRLFLALAYFQTNVIGLHAAEASFWNERRRALRSAAPPAAAPDPLAQLPSAARAEFGAVLPAGSVPSFPPESGPPSAWLSALVSPYGTLREVHFSSRPGAPLVVHIQDVHEIEEAQRN